MSWCTLVMVADIGTSYVAPVGGPLRTDGAEGADGGTTVGAAGAVTGAATADVGGAVNTGAGGITGAGGVQLGAEISGVVPPTAP